jgi:hypothetical protein
MSILSALLQPESGEPPQVPRRNQHSRSSLNLFEKQGFQDAYILPNPEIASFDTFC